MVQKVNKYELFEDFIRYCEEDNEKLAHDIKIWLIDYFDCSHRHIELTEPEKEWLKSMSPELKKEMECERWL